MSSLGERIAKIRKSMGDTQAEFAIRFNRATSTIGNWEGNRKKPKHKELIEIARLGNISIEELLGVSDDFKLIHDGQVIDPKKQKLIADLTRRIIEVEGVEKRMLFNALEGLLKKD